MVPLTDPDTAKEHAQREFTGKVSHELQRGVFRDAADETDVARLLSASGYAAGMWLQGSLADKTLRMAGMVFKVAMLLRLGVPCGLVCPAQRCAVCGERVDPEGHHHLVCRGGQLIARHDRFVAQLAAMLRAALGRGRVHVHTTRNHGYNR